MDTEKSFQALYLQMIGTFHLSGQEAERILQAVFRRLEQAQTTATGDQKE